MKCGSQNLLICIAAVALVTASSFGAVTKLNERVFVIEGGGGKGSNVGVLLGERSIHIVDSMVPDAHEFLAESIESISTENVSHLFLTHDHFDHTGSLQRFTDSGAFVVASEKSELSGTANVMLFGSTLSFRAEGLQIDAYTVDSHSGSDVLYHLPQYDIVFLGDVYTDEWYPSFFSGGLSGQLNAIDLALELGGDTAQYVPGHGKIASSQDLQAYLTIVQKWVSRIMLLSAEGKSPSEIAKDGSILEIRESFVSEKTNRANFDKWIKQLIQNTIDVEQRNIH